MAGKEKRFWAAYLALTQAAAWIEHELRTPLGLFGIARQEFRMLVQLYEDGPMTLSEAAAKLGRKIQSVSETAERSAELGWVERTEKRLPPVKHRETKLPKARRGRARAGARVVELSLTPRGRKLIADVLPKQAGIVKALMAGIDARELDSLIRICGKLREGNLLSKVRFVAAVASLPDQVQDEEGETAPIDEKDGG